MKLDDFIVGWSGGRITQRPVELVDLWEDVCEAAWKAVGIYLEDLDSFTVHLCGEWCCCDFTMGNYALAVSYASREQLVEAIGEVISRFRPLRELIAQDLERWDAE